LEQVRSDVGVDQGSFLLVKLSLQLILLFEPLNVLQQLERYLELDLFMKALVFPEVKLSEALVGEEQLDELFEPVLRQGVVSEVKRSHVDVVP